MARAPRSPAQFVVARHLVSHPEDAPGDIAAHCHLLVQSAARAYKRVFDQTQLQPGLLLETMRAAGEKPTWRTFRYWVPNPGHWPKAAKVQAWLSGEHAAETVDGLDLVSSRRIYYIRPDDLPAAMQAASDIFAKCASARQANLALRVADPWMDLTGQVAERGQRWYDYASSSNLQLARWRP